MSGGTRRARGERVDGDVAGRHAAERSHASASQLAEARSGAWATGAAALAPPDARGDESTAWRDRWVPGAGGVRLHAVEAGAGTPVVLLHGFPDFWFGWRHQLSALAAAGFRAVAPDLRGYNLSDRPPRVADYRLDALADDVAALVRSLDVPRAHVVGHDWGGAIAWHLAVRHPDLVDRLVILNAPHLARFRRLLPRSTQALRSWYIGFFQIPWLPERLLGLRRGAVLRRTLRAMHRRPGALGAREQAAYAAAFRDPRARWAALAYYRAVVRRGTAARERPQVRHRTLVIWGERDPALVRANASGLERWVPDVRVLRVPDAGHWVMTDAPERVNAALVAFLREP